MLGYADSRWIFLRPALSPCIYTEFRYRKLGGKWVDRPTMPSTYHKWAMLDNQLEKGFELKGGMMGGVSIQRLLGKVSTAGSCKTPNTIRPPICCCNNCACAVAIILDLLTLFNLD